MSYKHIFIDLDRTLYDFDKSTYDTFTELFRNYGLYDQGIEQFDKFMETYQKINIELWDQYREGKIKKKFLNVHRFHLTLLEFGINDRAFAGRFASDYVRLSPLKNALFPGVIETLQYLHAKYSLHIITNGFEEVQKTKMKANNLECYFKTVTTSEEARAKKPDKRIFSLALEKAGAFPDDCLMIGDDLAVDIVGAQNFGMDQVYCNYYELPHNNDITFEVNSFKEIKDIL